MSEIDDEAAALKNLGRSKPSPAGFRQAEQALASKWEGLQSLALQVFAAWGHRKAIDLIVPFLDQAFARKSAWAIRKVAIETLAGLVDRDDQAKVEALVQRHRSGLENYELRPLLKRLETMRRR